MRGSTASRARWTLGITGTAVFMTALDNLVVGVALPSIRADLVLPTAAEAVLASVRPDEAGKASGATNAIREMSGVMGVAVLATVFASNGGYESPQAFTDGVVAALPIAVVVLAVGALLALLTPSDRAPQPQLVELAAEPANAHI